MNKANSEMADDLRAEYDLKKLRVRTLGAGRKSFASSTVCPEPDVAKVFSSAESVNEALRFLIKVVQKTAICVHTATETSLGSMDKTP